MEILDYLVEKYSGQEFTTEELQTDEDLMNLFKTKKTAVKKRSTRGAKSSEERVKEDYDPERCDCRVFLNGFGGQCTHKKIDGCVMCKHHGEGGKWSNLVDENGNSATVNFDTSLSDSTAVFEVSLWEEEIGYETNHLGVFDNDSIGFNQVFSNYYAYDDGTAEKAYALDAIGGQLAVRFPLAKADTPRRCFDTFYTIL